MKVKDIVKEGFFKSFARELLPKALKPVFDKDKLPPDMYKDAKKAFELFGVGPDYDEKQVQDLVKGMSPERAEEIRKKAGAASWLTDFQKMQKQVDVDAALGPQDELKRDADRASPEAFSQIKPPTSSQSAHAMAKDIFGARGGAAKSAPTAPPNPTAPPPQVQLPSGEYITKYGDSWYNEQGQKVVDPGSIASLDRRAQKPSGQTQMATTKNVPVNLPGYRGKRK